MKVIAKPKPLQADATPEQTAEHAALVAHYDALKQARRESYQTSPVRMGMTVPGHWISLLNELLARLESGRPVDGLIRSKDYAKVRNMFLRAEIRWKSRNDGGSRAAEAAE